MRRTSEKGEGKLGTFILFALLAAVGLAAWNLIPVYYAHYDFTDAVEEICRTPVYKARTPQAIRDMLIKEVRNRELEQWITPDSFQISRTDRNRRIHLYYEREVDVLPGWKKLIKFEYTAEQPLL
jgi:hypothetical protein